MVVVESFTFANVVVKIPPPSVLLLDNEAFREHLSRHRQEILRTVSSLYQKISPSNDSETQNSLKAALAKNNALISDVSRLTAERDERDDRLTDTMMRLLQLEKRLDRSKSLSLQKIEAQATQKAKEEPEEVQENGEGPSRPSSRVMCKSSMCQSFRSAFKIRLSSSLLQQNIKLHWK
jgi:hypothetical protein